MNENARVYKACKCLQLTVFQRVTVDYYGSVVTINFGLVERPSLMAIFNRIGLAMHVIVKWFDDEIATTGYEMFFVCPSCF